MRDRALAKLYPVSSHSSLLYLFLPSCPAAGDWAAPPGAAPAQRPCLGQVEPCSNSSLCWQSRHPAFLLALLLAVLNTRVTAQNAWINADFKWISLPCYISCLFPQRHRKNSFVRWPHFDFWSWSSSARLPWLLSFYLSALLPVLSEAKCISGLF